MAGTPKLGTNGVDLSTLTSEEKLVMALEEESRMATEARACTGFSPSNTTINEEPYYETNISGVLGIHPLARDIKVDNFSVTFYGAELLQDTKLELSCGNRSVFGRNRRLVYLYIRCICLLIKIVQCCADMG